MPHAKPRLIVIDTDPGIDDAIGILLALASPEFSIAGITTVAGNIGIETTTRNAGRLLAFAGRERYSGLHRLPLLPCRGRGRSRSTCMETDGIGGVALPEPARAPEMPACRRMAG